MRCLGIDVGSTSIKGAVLDLGRGIVEGVRREPFPPAIGGLPAGQVEIDAEEVVRRTGRVLSALLDEEPDAAGIFVAGQMGGVLLVDDRGTPLTNYLSWRDQRTSLEQNGPSMLAAVRGRWSDRQFDELGRELQPGSATSLLYWLRKEGQLPGSARLATIGDFAISRLCGSVPQMHRTQAIGLLDLQTGEWHGAALAALGLDELMWDAPVTLAEPTGKWRVLGRAIPCYAAIGDQQCALFGAGLEQGELSINVSTGSQVSRRGDRFEPGPYQSRYFLGGDFLHTITHLPAGRSLNVLVDFVTEFARHAGADVSRAWEYVATVADAADGGGIECDLSFFKGPLGERGRIDGVTTENLTVGNLFRAAFESMAENYAMCAARLQPSAGWSRIVLSGGLTQSIPLLRSTISRRFELDLREPAAAEETLLGLLRIAVARLREECVL